MKNDLKINIQPFMIHNSGTLIAKGVQRVKIQMVEMGNSKVMSFMKATIVLASRWIFAIRAPKGSLETSYLIQKICALHPLTGDIKTTSTPLHAHRHIRYV